MRPADRPQPVQPEQLSGDETILVPVAEEQLRVGTRRRVTGRVQVHLGTESHKEAISADLLRESVTVERVPVGRVVDSIPAVRDEGDTTIIPVVEERLVVETRLVLVEEIRLTRHRKIRPYSETVTLRRQRATIERLPPEGDR